MSEPHNPLPEFFELLHEAADASQEVDDYKITKDSAISVRIFKILQEHQRITAIKLIEYIDKYGHKIISSLGG